MSRPIFLGEGKTMLRDFILLFVSTEVLKPILNVYKNNNRDLGDQ